MLTLNIGLNRARDPGVRNSVSLTLGAVATFLGATHAHAVHQSDTEPTIVIELEGRKGLRQRVYALAKYLGQECIASYSPELDHGELIGPAPWGDFDPCLFLLLDGRRASERVLA